MAPVDTVFSKIRGGERYCVKGYQKSTIAILAYWAYDPKFLGVEAKKCRFVRILEKLQEDVGVGEKGKRRLRGLSQSQG